MMRNTLSNLTVAVLAGLFLLTSGGCASVPKPVKDSVDARFPGATITNMEKENENGGVVYDYELKHNGRKYEMDIKEDGTVMEIEKEIKDVPPAVSIAVKGKFANSTIKEVMEVNMVKGKDETPDHYEVTLTDVGGKEMEVNVSLDGTKVEDAASEEKEKK
jgi:hypothetical protein